MGDVEWRGPAAGMSVTRRTALSLLPDTDVPDVLEVPWRVPKIWMCEPPAGRLWLCLHEEGSM